MRSATLLAAAAAVLALGAASAGHAQDTSSLLRITRIARASIVVPQDWDGIWSTVDTSYTCAGGFQSTSTYEDTLCGGKDFNAGSGDVHFECTGTGTSTTFDAVCSGSNEVLTGCTATYTIHIHATRSGDTNHIVDVVNVDYSGTSIECSYLQPMCTQVDSWGTRTGAAPVAYCTTTPTRTATWGQVRIHYR